MLKKIALFIFIIPAFAFSPTGDCGDYRYDYKILIDDAGLTLFNKRGVKSSIGELVAIPRPSKEQMHNRRADQEKRIVTVTAFITACGKEDDRDYHLILKSLNGEETLIAEIPDPTCEKLKGFPGLREDFTAARSFVEQNIDSTPGAISPLSVPLKVVVKGAVFFDKTAHGNGHAPNGIEIHPILRIRKS